MKKAIIFLLTGAVTLVTLCMFSFSASAAEAVSVSIPVEIEGGGTAEIISEVNCPLPESSSVEVKDGATENINIGFSAPGDFKYTIQVESKDEVYYSPEYYTANVAVRTDSGGELSAIVILTKAESDYKPDKCLFALTEKPTDAPKTEPVVPTKAANDPPTSRPKTGDDSMLDIYLLICIVASGGLFILSVIYSVSTEKLIGRK